MAGCFGNHPVDRWMESQLDAYLSKYDDEQVECESCHYVSNQEEWDYDEDYNELECPNCGHRFEL